MGRRRGRSLGAPGISERPPQGEGDSHTLNGRWRPAPCPWPHPAPSSDALDLGRQRLRAPEPALGVTSAVCRLLRASRGLCTRRAPPQLWKPSPEPSSQGTRGSETPEPLPLLLPLLTEPPRLSLSQHIPWVLSCLTLGVKSTWATHSSVLAWRIPGTGEPGGLPSMGSHRVRHN